MPTSIAELVSYLKNREFSLFIGAGASVSGGGPTNKKLLSSIKAKYPIANGEDDFFNVFDKILKDEKDRPEVEQFLYSLLISITPNDDHRYLLSLPWRAILTTNYDRIPDLIDTTLDKNRTIQTIISSDPRVDIRKEDSLYCFKLFGDMSVSCSNDGYMVLKNADRRRAYTRQATYFNLFRDLAKSGIVIYMGYSFEDQLVFELLEDMLFDAKGFPHRGFAITPHQPNEEKLSRMKKLNIEWVQGTLEEFVTESKKVFGEIPQSSSIYLNPVKVHGRLLDLERTTLSNIRGQAKVVNQGYYIPDNDNPKVFLEGKDHSFVPFQRGWYFPRNWSIDFISSNIKFTDVDTIQKFVEFRTKVTSPKDNLIVALRGKAGSGKSIVANKIAHEWYATSGNPVLFIDSTSSFLDSTAIANLMDEIWTKYRKMLGKDEEPGVIRYLIICDNGSLVYSQIRQIMNDLTSAGKPVDIMLVDRYYELQDSELKEIGTQIAFSLNDTVTNEESKQFISHFQTHQIIQDISAVSYNLRNSEINSSFFALMYTCIREVQVPLKEIVLEEFKKKPPETKKLYSLISLIQSFGLKPYDTLLVKTIGKDYETISTMIESGQLRGVIGIDKDKHSFQTNHRIIADIIRNYIFPTPDLLKKGLASIISEVTEGNITEMELVEKILIHTPSIKEQVKDRNLEELFETATKKVKTRPLFLHLAMVQLDLHKHKECRLSLDMAKKIQHPSFPESLEHVFDVEGRLELALSRDSLPKDPNEAWEHLLKAEAAFKQSHDSIGNPHSTLGLSQTYRQMSKMQSQREQIVNFLLLALDRLQMLRNNSPDWFSLEGPQDIEKKTFEEMKSLGFNETDAEMVFERNHNANGYAFLAESKIGTDDDEALRLTNEGLKHDGHSIWLLRIKVNLLKKNQPDNIDEFYDTLLQYGTGSIFDLQLSFELAKTEYIKGNWDLADVAFRNLRQKSKGYRNRLIPTAGDRWLEKGKPKIFHGIVVKVPTIDEWGCLRSNDPPIPRVIPVEHKYMGYQRYAKYDKVSFEIVFNMVGPQASEVKIR